MGRHLLLSYSNGNNFCKFLFASVGDKHIPNGVVYKRRNLILGIAFPLRYDHTFTLEKGNQNENERAISHECVAIYLKKTMVSMRSHFCFFKDMNSFQST